MRRLMLLRHAKSSWRDPTLSDFDRPLAPRGEKAAPRMGAFMRAQGLVPDVVLSSSAVRARQTMALALDALACAPQRIVTRRLYHAPLDVLFEEVRGLDDAHESALVIGHNPGLQAFALALLARERSAEALEIARHYPTAALVVMALDIAAWSQLARGTARLELYQVPRALP